VNQTERQSTKGSWGMGEDHVQEGQAMSKGSYKGRWVEKCLASQVVSWGSPGPQWREKKEKVGGLSLVSGKGEFEGCRSATERKPGVTCGLRLQKKRGEEGQCPSAGQVTEKGRRRRNWGGLKAACASRETWRRGLNITRLTCSHLNGRDPIPNGPSRGKPLRGGLYF